ncbi:triose-phosphate isomerase [Blochmannia endosymbiont of Camponotus sp. C-003]|uniref:triose-phosphate isomerase n=1 Tax=Blochmannia endosymbiont of Camponotus sp. C-003 TaxID=2945588 RepID=UPI002023CC63|nr:triose-phosphate isomerase [Blochmannia endosymbiont of Camponotus sp. C-003]URJ23257.1 triose-phosphate isomerase [Blochmannia endosymbiont of Camponotus sp. C-003]
MRRRLLVIGNWKLNGNKNTITNLTITLVNTFCNISKCSVAIAPPVMYLDIVKRYLLNNTHIQLCAQNVDIHLSGAFTGEISAEMLQDCNVRYVLIGHSERRIHHKENDAYIAKKFFILKKVGLIPILCIGENKREYDSGCTQSICINQIKTVIKLLGIEALKNSVIAYEPIWSIGSGVSASPESVQMVHKSIRDYIASYDVSVADEIIIQYGGSVTPENVTQFFDQKDIDGVLVGAASLNANSFAMIVQTAEKHKKLYLS